MQSGIFTVPIENIRVLRMEFPILYTHVKSEFHICEKCFETKIKSEEEKEAERRKEEEDLMVRLKMRKEEVRKAKEEERKQREEERKQREEEEQMWRKEQEEEERLRLLGPIGRFEERFGKLRDIVKDPPKMNKREKYKWVVFETDTTWSWGKTYTNHHFDSSYESKTDAYQRAKLVVWLKREDDFREDSWGGPLVEETLSKDTLKFQIKDENCGSTYTVQAMPDVAYAAVVSNNNNL